MQEPNRQNILLTIFHFNDVYDIQENEKGKYGIVRFEAHLRKLKQQFPNHLVLFSGDAFSPSILSNIFHGKQMVRALNTLQIDAACYGNHEFDFEPAVTMQLSNSCNFPWLLANIREVDSERRLCDARDKMIKEVNNLKVGILGVAGQDWPGILTDNYEDQLDYDDVGQVSRDLSFGLREKQKCDIVIALTHMRVPQDQKLPYEAPAVDLVLGGHDHITMKEFINQIPVIKSGDNFKKLGIIHIYDKNKPNQAEFKGINYDFDIQIQQIPEMCEDPNLQLREYVDECVKKYYQYDEVLGFCDVPLDTLFCHVRTGETNYANFLADLVRNYYSCDCCILNSGAIRNDIIVPPGELRFSVLSNLINNPVVVKEISGASLRRALQHGCEGLPNVFSGSFLCVSGLRFSYDVKKSPKVQQIWVQEAPLDENKLYSVACQFYIAQGGDGFQTLKGGKFIVDQVSGINLLSLLLKFFRTVKDAQQAPLDKATSQGGYEGDPENQQQGLKQLEMLTLNRKITTRVARLVGLENKHIVEKNGQRYVCISPTVDGRIIAL